MFVSTIIATINRPTLSAAVYSVLDQHFDEDDYEVIVVNDTGKPLPGYPWQESERATVLTTQKRERSVARNTGAAIARGTYLHFLDGDDVLAEGALQAFWKLSKLSNADWLYGSYLVLERDGRIRAEHKPTLAGDIFALCFSGELIPLQASLFSAARFHEVGGFDPTFTIVEDHDLMRRFTFRGRIAGTEECVAHIKTGREGSTGDWSRHSQQELISREKILSWNQVGARIETSVNGKPYWRGRAARIYLASALQNLKEGRPLIAVDRVLSAVALSRHHVVRTGFVRGIRRIIPEDPKGHIPQSLSSR